MLRGFYFPIPLYKPLSSLVVFFHALHEVQFTSFTSAVPIYPPSSLPPLPYSADLNTRLIKIARPQLKLDRKHLGSSKSRWAARAAKGSLHRTAVNLSGRRAPLTNHNWTHHLRQTPPLKSTSFHKVAFRAFSIGEYLAANLPFHTTAVMDSRGLGPSAARSHSDRTGGLGDTISDSFLLRLAHSMAQRLREDP